MEKIKSKKAKELIECSYFRSDFSKNYEADPTLRRDYMAKTNASLAVIFAEQEAEERHAKDMQGLKDKITNLSICDIDAPVFTHTIEFRSHFDYIKKCFIQKLYEL